MLKGVERMGLVAGTNAAFFVATQLGRNSCILSWFIELDASHKLNAW